MILNLQTAKPLLTLALLAVPCFAGEIVELSTGFRIHAERHEAEGSVVRLYANGGVTEVPAALVVHFEAEEALPTAPAAVAETSARLPVLNGQELINAAARRHGLPPEFVASVVSAESDFRPGAVSPKGAIGLMQLMPATAREYGADPRDPRQNVEAGTQYLRDLLFKYQNNDHQVSRALAAYNAGPGAVDRYHGMPPYRETRAYVARVLRKYEKKQAQAAGKTIPSSGD
jgi:soluble lytic murein transglycosylase-like protein